MIRAGVFIGVDQTGGLQRLYDGATGAASMHAWALAQGMKEQNAKLITDADGRKVTVDHVYDAIEEIVNGPGVDQLIVYFAGHGVNINRNEHWLLSDAPVRTSAAIDVTSSAVLARYSGIRHVVFISDACRVAPEGIQAQSVRGCDVFPNDGAGERGEPVDQFFACLLGRTAAEIKDPAFAAGSYSALYTRALLDALYGQRSEVLEVPTGDAAGYVKPRRLEAYLEAEIPARIKARGLANKVNQSPDAIITSDGQWLSRVEFTPEPVGRGGEGYFGGDESFNLEPLPAADPMAGPSDGPPGGPPDEISADHRGVFESVAHSALEGDRTRLTDALSQLRIGNARMGAQFTRTMEAVAAPIRSEAVESDGCIKVQGTAIVDVFSAGATVELVGGELVRVNDLRHGAVSVVVQVQGEAGTVVPVLPGFLAGLTFEDGQLVDISYEPMVGSYRWHDFTRHADELRMLRAVAASSSMHGRFQLDRPDAGEIARRMQLGKGVDPTLAVYAAYAYHDLQEIERVREMSRFLTADLGVRLFDIELLSRRLVDRMVDSSLGVMPAVPLLSQGWALLRANRVTLRSPLERLSDTLDDSVWSLYSPAGLDLLRNALAKGDVR